MIDFKDNPTKTKYKMKPVKFNTPFSIANVVHGCGRPCPTIQGVVKLSSRSLQKFRATVFHNNIMCNDSHLVFQDLNGWALYKIGKIMKCLASCLPPECKKKTTNHSAKENRSQLHHKSFRLQAMPGSHLLMITMKSPKMKEGNWST